jgi:hypothetical protein
MVRYQMLHDSADGINRVLECSAERGLLPAPREPTVARRKVQHQETRSAYRPLDYRLHRGRAEATRGLAACQETSHLCDRKDSPTTVYSDDCLPERVEFDLSVSASELTMRIA